MARVRVVRVRVIVGLGVRVTDRFWVGVEVGIYEKRVMMLTTLPTKPTP
jgi:hypothetical protein